MNTWTKNFAGCHQKRGKTGNDYLSRRSITFRRRRIGEFGAKDHRNGATKKQKSDTAHLINKEYPTSGENCEQT